MCGQGNGDLRSSGEGQAQESMVEASSAEALTLGKEKQELEKIMSDLRKSAEAFMYEMVMAEMDQYKTVVLAEANIKGVIPPTFEDEPAIPSASDMKVDFSVKPDRFST
ncbi:hypothetical protein F2Q69_00021324 [Brassica cretica]|uniref:Uncharacterized protein n=1 Tax=Brassica cretica TaxID=69181 RepID=A0A8S9Q2V4_BRACR|nr:hypothetical protein F2Q69_00021324 [Brassica cretica]